MKKALLFAIVFAVCASMSAFAQEGADSLRRFAVYIGANNGGPERPLLRYAETDAQNISSVMEEIGGVESANRLILINPAIADVEASFAAMRERVSSAVDSARRVEFLFYYSGHSDEYGIMLSDGNFAYADIRSRITSVGAGISIAILDSCSSGSFTQLRGGSRQSPFLIDDSSQMSGHAFLTSSSASESAQESQRIQGAFFTHFLVSGLRGGADASGDGQVTLNEAYAYAYSETLARTMGTIAGPQHPSYNIQLSGSGDLILTDIRSTEAVLNLANDIVGRLYVRNARGILVAEVQKNEGASLTLALPEGQYELTIETSGQTRVARVVLRPDSPVAVTAQNFRQTARIANATRGDDGEFPLEESSEGTEVALENGGDVTDLTFDKPPVLLGETDATPAEEAEAAEGTVFPSDIETAEERALNGQVDPAAILEEARRRYQTIEERALALQESLTTRTGSRFSLDGASASYQPENGFGLSFGVVGTRRGDFSGIQMNLIVSNIQGNGSVFQSGLIGCSTSGDYTGVQAGSIFATAGGAFRGVQLAGIFNSAGRDVIGVQSAGVFNRSGGLNGAQLGGVFNVSEGDTSWLQSSGVFNIAGGSMSGLQAAGVFNIARGAVNGVQAAGVFNIAGDVNGVQASGFLNKAGNVRGVQIGIVNIAESMRGIPIGIVNIVHDGLYHVNAWYENMEYGFVAFQTGSRSFYNVYSVGAPVDFATDTPATPFVDVTRIVMGFSLGTQLELGPFYGQVELGARQLMNFSAASWETFLGIPDGPNYPIPTLRALAGLRLGTRIGLYGGVTVEGPWFAPEGRAGYHNEAPLAMTIGSTNLYFQVSPMFGIRF